MKTLFEKMRDNRAKRKTMLEWNAWLACQVRDNYIMFGGVESPPDQTYVVPPPMTLRQFLWRAFKGLFKNPLH